ncbi:MAG: hypothetical protein R3C14_12470 [Caldilineaceae bacterium]
MQMKRTFLYTHLLPFAGYTILTILVTWPVFPHFLTHIPGYGDAPMFLWEFWWFKHALLDLRQSPFTTDLIYYPLTDVPVTAQTPINEFFTLPLQVAIGVAPLYNLLFLASYIFSGYFTYWLGLTLVRRRDLAFLGGVIFAFCAYRGMRGLGHMSLLTTQWMPLALLLAVQCWRRPTIKRALATGVVTSLVALSSPYYLGLFLFPVLLVGGLYLLVWHWRTLWRWPLWQAGAVAALVFLIITVPFYLPMFIATPEIQEVNQSLAYTAEAFSADLLSWLLPAGLHPLWGKFTGPLYDHFATPNLMETTVFVGILPLLFAVLSFGIYHHHKMLRFWQLLALTSGVLAFGPYLHINGQIYARGMLFQWLLYLPGFDAFRAPNRAGITTALAISMLAIMTLQQLRQRFSARPWSLFIPILAALILVNVTPLFPYPLSNAVIPAVYTPIAQANDRKALVELPAGEYYGSSRNFFEAAGWYMYYQSYHQKPIVSGRLGRQPARLRYPEQHLPVVRRFFLDEGERTLVDMPPLALLPDPFWPDEISRGQELLAQEGIGHVLLHRLLLDSQTATAINTLLKQALWLPVAGLAKGDSIIHYEVQPPAYQSHYVPTYLTNPPLFFDGAFSAPQIDARGRLRTLTQSGTASFTLSLPGVWSIQGELVGADAGAIRFTLDGAGAFPQLVQTQSSLAFRLEQMLQPGAHTLRLELPTAPQPTQSAQATDNSCTNFCVRNLYIRLKEPDVAPDAIPLATFSNAAGQQLELLATTEWTAQESGQDAHFRFLLITWRLNEKSYTVLEQSPAQMPSTLVILTDADANSLAQVDHRLGERMVQWPAERILFDLVALPATEQELTITELSLTLVDPATQQSFATPDATQLDALGRVQLGVVTNLQQTLPLPPIEINPALQITFTHDVDGHILRLLNAQLQAANEDPTRLQLISIWEQPDLFRPEVPVTLFVDIAAPTGETLQRTIQQFQPYQLSWHHSALLFDVLSLPRDLPLTGPEEVWIGLWSPSSQLTYRADRIDRLDSSGRIRLGTVDDLKSVQ